MLLCCSSLFLLEWIGIRRVRKWLLTVLSPSLSHEAIPIPVSLKIVWTVYSNLWRQFGWYQRSVMEWNGSCSSDYRHIGTHAVRALLACIMTNDIDVRTRRVERVQANWVANSISSQDHKVMRGCGFGRSSYHQPRRWLLFVRRVILPPSTLTHKKARWSAGIASDKRDSRGKVGRHETDPDDVDDGLIIRSTWIAGRLPRSWAAAAEDLGVDWWTVGKDRQSVDGRIGLRGESSWTDRSAPLCLLSFSSSIDTLPPLSSSLNSVTSPSWALIVGESNKSVIQCCVAREWCKVCSSAGCNGDQINGWLSVAGMWPVLTNQLKQLKTPMTCMRTL